MLFRLLMSGLLLSIGVGFSGCSPGGEGQLDELKNPYFLAGKDRLAERDYKGAIESFEKALEANPHSAQAHFELGVLYEQHSDQKEEDYVSAMYHYNQAVKLHPNDYPADNARQRITYCKRELVKAESLAPVAQNLMRELDKLREENQLLRKQAESLSPQTIARLPAHSKTAATQIVLAPATAPVLSNATFISRNPPMPSPVARERITPLTPAGSLARTHIVKSGETLFSIARQYHLKLDALLSANPALDPKRMKVGQILTLPPA